MPPKRSATASGIQTKSGGDRIIPASVRPDGSIRPERKVKAGYTPAEDVSAYKSEKAESFRSNQYGSKEYVPPGVKKAGEAKKQVDLGVGQEDPEKKARALKKKIKQAKELKERQEKGDKLEPNQVAKISMIDTFEKELASLNIEDKKED